MSAVLKGVLVVRGGHAACGSDRLGCLVSVVQSDLDTRRVGDFECFPFLCFRRSCQEPRTWHRTSVFETFDEPSLLQRFSLEMYVCMHARKKRREEEEEELAVGGVHGVKS